MEQGIYEVWVTRIRQWGDDPTITLADLPQMTEESLTPRTFERLFKHMEASIQKMMDTWKDNLEDSMKQAKTPFEISQVLKHSRDFLYHRVEFCSNPALPEKVRTILMDGTRSSIEDLQKQMEKSAVGNSADAIGSTAMLEILKESPFTLVLSDGYASQDRVMEVIDKAEAYNQQLTIKRNMPQALSEKTENKGGFFSRFKKKK